MIGLGENSEIFVFIPTKRLIQKYTFDDGKLEMEYGPFEAAADSIQTSETCNKIFINDEKKFKLKVLEIQ